MLYHLREFFQEFESAFNVLRYLTFRAICAFVFTLVFVLVLQPRFIRFVREKKLGQPIRDDGPQTHLGKKGTPTMGGVVVVMAVLITTFLLSDLTNIYVWLTCFLTAVYGGLGFLDDYRKVIKSNPKGVSAREKLFWQFGGAIVAVMFLVFMPGFSTALSVPFTKELYINLGYWYIPFGVLVVVGCSNAVNLTDGLDGLVIGPIMTVAFAYGVFSYVSGHAQIASYLHVPLSPGAEELSIFAAAMIASGLGFLWFNSFPAQVFLGDVGALSLGGAIGMLALISKQELILLIAGGVFVVEAASVILQVASFKLTGKRIFRMAPLHHHFELKGIAEPKIIVRFWIISLLLAVISLASLKLR
jgi:phospho-N-acetylmuramoyl-pentapeptide-transferase